MDLPTLIASLFDGVNAGVLVPILEGINAVFPAIVVLSLLAAVLALLFAERKAAKIGAVVAVLAIAYVWQFIPDLVSALLEYNVAAAGDPSALDLPSLIGDGGAPADGGATAQPEPAEAPENPSLGEM